jgi:hypothetical protein
LYLAKAMSALETTVRVSSEKQTLILAGEPVPRRFAFNASALQRPLTLVATPVDDPKLIAQGGFEDLSPESGASSRNLVLSASFAARGSAYNAADAYVRTQQLSIDARSAIIDTYA